MDKGFKEYLMAFRPTIESNLNECKAVRDKFLAEEPKELHDEINEQFLDAMRDDVALELANTFSNANAEDIAIFMEEFDIKNWLENK